MISYVDQNYSNLRISEYKNDKKTFYVKWF